MTKPNKTTLEAIQECIESLKKHPEKNGTTVISHLTTLEHQATEYVQVVKEVARGAPFKWVVTQGGAGGYFLEEKDYNLLLVEGRIR